MGYAWVVWHFLGNVKHCERIDVQLEECENEEKTKGMECGSTSANVDCLQ